MPMPRALVWWVFCLIELYFESTFTPSGRMTKPFANLLKAIFLSYYEKNTDLN